MKKYLKILIHLVSFWKFILASIAVTIVYLTANIFAMPLARDIIVIIDQGAFDKVPRVLGLVVLLFGVRQLCESAQVVIMGYVGRRFQVDWRRRLFDQFLNLSMSFHGRYKVGDMVTRLTSDITITGGAVMRNIQKLLPQTLTILGVFIYLLFQNWQLTIVTLLILPIAIGMIVLIGKKIRVLSHSIQSDLSSTTHIAQESLNNINLVKSFVKESYETDRFFKVDYHQLCQAIRLLVYDNIAIVLTSVMQLLALVGVIGFGIYQVKAGYIIAAELSQFVVGIALIIDPLNSLSMLYKETMAALAAFDRVLDIMNQDSCLLERSHIQNSPAITSGHLSIESVTFQYPNTNKPVLDAISFQVNAGEVVALVGASGAGKSTLIQLIPRFYDPDHGQICLGGHPLTAISLADLRQAIGIVPQESRLFTGTVRDNLHYGKATATEDELVYAAQQANAWSFIEALPDGLDTYLGDRGHKLSGGQRQRIAIARAILKDPLFLILDEATSALDSESERLVQDALNRLMENRTTLVIAHRLSTISRANTIIVLDHGRIAEMGDHHALLSRDGLYKRFYNLQHVTNIT